ncbi:MAG TPA: class I SAM-dependent methyltransferase [Thermoanaerobaculia bacterium]|nr:class I SAM-dependent methyltransferase [Thermoanaerobaculia bacterium]
MSIYRHHIFPRLCHRALRDEETARRRRETLAALAGEVLEIGFGTGHNLPCYPATVTRVVGVEPNPGMHRLAARQVAAASQVVELVEDRAEELPFADASFDAVVSTFTLCSLADPTLALAELRRVLRPGGAFAFLEHGLAPEPKVARWQLRLTPLQRVVGDGCHLDRKIDDLVAAGGFTVEHLETGYQPGPKVASYLYKGLARADGRPARGVQSRSSPP